MTKSKMKGSVSLEKLNEKRAAVIEDVMRLRYEQARLKTEIVKQARAQGRPDFIPAIVRCW